MKEKKSTILTAKRFDSVYVGLFYKTKVNGKPYNQYIGAFEDENVEELFCAPWLRKAVNLLPIGEEFRFYPGKADFLLPDECTDTEERIMREVFPVSIDDKEYYRSLEL